MLTRYRHLDECCCYQTGVAPYTAEFQSQKKVNIVDGGEEPSDDDSEEAAKLDAQLRGQKG